MRPRTTCAIASRACAPTCRRRPSRPRSARSTSTPSRSSFSTSSSSTLSPLELTDYAERVHRRRVSACCPASRSVRMNGARRYAMRVWIDREALAARQLTVDDIESALRRENVAAPGRPARVDARANSRCAPIPGSTPSRSFASSSSVAARTATSCGSARSPTCGSRPRTSAASSRTNGVPGLEPGRRADLEGEHARGGRARVKDEMERMRPELPAGHESRGQSRPLRLHRRSR